MQREPGSALPRLRSSLPAARAIDVPRDEWFRLEFECGLVEGAERGVALSCDGEPLAASVLPLGARELVVNPDRALPAAAACELSWRGDDGPRRLRFTTAGAGLPAFVRYDRRDSRATAPFPDDFWLRTGSDGDESGRLAIDLGGIREPSQSLVSAFIAGGRRYSEVLIHQAAQVFLDQLAYLGFDDLFSTDVWVALSLFQTLLDPQDSHLHAPLLWRQRLALPGTSRRASVLLVEGVGDSFVPNHATESLAAAFFTSALGGGAPVVMDPHGN